jgi:hypothetical protein
MQREALIEKLRGVSNEDARRAATVSSLSLLSLVKHSAIWERRWFQVIVAGRSFLGEWPEVHPQDENAFRLTDDDTVETVVAYYREQIAASQEIVGSFDLDAPCAWPEMAHENLRWVALHMIEETARHAGHADSSAKPSTAAAGKNSPQIRLSAYLPIGCSTSMPTFSSSGCWRTGQVPIPKTVGWYPCKRLSWAPWLGIRQSSAPQCNL